MTIGLATGLPFSGGLAQTQAAQANPAKALEASSQAASSLGPDGIDAQVLQAAPYHLTGRKIAIGQVEPGRPGLFGFDKNIAAEGQGVPLAGLFFRDQSATENTHVDVHAHGVASLMVGQAKQFGSIAPGARLFSSALGSRRTGAQQAEQCLALSHVAQQNSGDLRAINLSFGESLQLDQRANAVLDGNALLTQCLDWSARVHDVFYAVAGNQGKGGIPIPTDQYNGVTVAYTRRQDGVFRKLDFANLGDELEALAFRFVGLERNLQGRGSVGLVAPGNEVEVLKLGGVAQSSSGTSFAAPHVTGTVALLQEYGDRIIRQALEARPSQAADLSPRRHEVMKAVLLNAADKLQDKGSGQQLGMTKTIIAQDNHDWSQSAAIKNPAMPLDPVLGAGQLNALRAYQQFSAGRQPPTTAVTARGWDYGQIEKGQLGSGPVAAYRDYAIAQPLQAGSYFVATLAWDRQVELVDVDRNQRYDLGERFRDRGLNNLDLYLMRSADTDSAQAIWSSISTVDSVEHIFQKIPVTDRYKLRVQYREQKHEPIQAYGLAWWGLAVR